MGERTHPDNCLWVFCCCGFLPILGIIKGIIIVGPITLINIIGVTGIAIILLPYDIFLSYRALCKTSIIGINLKIFSLLLLPIPLFLWPILVLVGSCFGGFLYGLFCPTFRTFDSSYNLIYGGFADVFQDIFEFIKEFWKYNYHGYFDFLKEIEERIVDQPFDINILQIIIGLILLAYGSVVGVTLLVIMWLVKLIPSIYKLYYELFKLYCELKCLKMIMFGILFLIAIVMIPVAGVLTIFAYIGYGLYGGIYCAIDGYKYNTGRGIISIFITIHECDEISNELIFDKHSSCLPDCEDKCINKK
jgi:hypothetical protein